MNVAPYPANKPKAIQFKFQPLLCNSITNTLPLNPSVLIIDVKAWFKLV